MTPEQFIARWQSASGSERANYQLFITELCELLDLPRPDPAREDTRDNAYVFERRVTFRHGDGSASTGFIDCYRRASAICEAKKVRAGAETKRFDDAMLRARGQAEGYARAREEAAGYIRWLRPCYQDSQASFGTVDAENRPETASTAVAETPASAATEKSPWPATLPEQMALPDLLQTLVALGRARQEGEAWRAAQL
jgi:hypothetical protein